MPWDVSTTTPSLYCPTDGEAWGRPYYCDDTGSEACPYCGTPAPDPHPDPAVLAVVSNTTFTRCPGRSTPECSGGLVIAANLVFRFISCDRTEPSWSGTRCHGIDTPALWAFAWSPELPCEPYGWPGYAPADDCCDAPTGATPPSYRRVRCLDCDGAAALLSVETCLGGGPRLVPLRMIPFYAVLGAVERETFVRFAVETVCHP